MIKVKYKLIIFLSFFALSHQVNAQDLVETYQLAFKNDPKLKKSYYTQFSVAESKSQSIAQMLPNLSFSARSSRNRLSNKKPTFQAIGVQNYWDHGLLINFSQPVFHWDHWVQLSQSDNKIAKAEADYKSDQQSLMVLTTEAYFDILSSKDNLAFTLSEQKAIERQLEQAKQRYDVGLIAITDVYEAQAGYDEAIANQIEAENELDDSKEALREIIGDNDENIVGLNKPIDFTHPTPNNISEWTKNAEVNNFSIIAALNEAEDKRKNVSIKQAGHLPTLDIVADYSLQDVNSSFGIRGDTQKVGLELNIPIFQGGATSSQAKQAHFDYQAAKEELLGTKRQVKRQIRNAFRDVVSSLSRVNALKATVTSAENALEATEAGFEVGTRTMVDVLSEQRNLYRTKRDYSRSRYDYLINGIKLKQTASSLTEQDLVVVNQYLGN
ncbi:MAG: TolC family outer membrane protein [Methylococcales bacterium]|nr:TolC family outer membrane protein [Methylococcales bacterium]